MRKFALILAMSAIFTTACNPKLDTAEHAGPEGEVHWSYAGESDPAHWGELKEEWELCAEGEAQSPIDVPTLSDTVRSDLPELRFEYDVTPLNPDYNGHTVQVDYEPGSYLYVGDEKYELKQFHFHTPSEHTFSGNQWPLEMHLVHQNDAGEYVVVAIFGRTDKGDDKAAAFVPVVSSLLQKRGIMFNVQSLFRPSKNYITYTGSLTSPPCTQGVTWILNGAASKITEDQVDALQSKLGHNARPVQPLNGRVVKSTGG